MSGQALYPKGAALVVGASGGVGGEICRLLARDGSDVVLTYRSNIASVEAAAEVVRAQGRQAHVVQLELKDNEAIKQAVATTVEQFGALHTVVYAAGPLLPTRHLSKVTPAEMAEVLQSDTLAFFSLVHASLPELRKSKGSVLAVHTCALYRWPPKDGMSAVPKAGVEVMIRGFAREEGRFGVRFNGIALGVLDAGMGIKMRAMGELDDRFLQVTLQVVPLGRLGTLNEAAEAGVFLTSSRAGYVTGHSILVDGGFHL